MINLTTFTPTVSHLPPSGLIVQILIEKCIHDKKYYRIRHAFIHECRIHKRQWYLVTGEPLKEHVAYWRMPKES